MAGHAPQYKIYNGDGVFVAACKRLEDAAALIFHHYPDGGAVKFGSGGPLLWRATEANRTADVRTIAIAMMTRLGEIQRAAYAKAHPEKGGIV